MQDALTVLQEQGAQVLTGGTPTTDTACGISNTLLRVAGRRFLQNPDVQQAETFWPTALPVIADNEEELAAITTQLEGGLTGTLYSHTAGADDELCARLAALMRPRVGRLLNDKMPTGEAVSPAMSDGGPYPATGHPDFTSVGLPATMRDHNPTGQLWRSIDGAWTQADVAA